MLKVNEEVRTRTVDDVLKGVVFEDLPNPEKIGMQRDLREYVERQKIEAGKAYREFCDMWFD
jgi:hypothetical protein